MESSPSTNILADDNAFAIVPALKVRHLDIEWIEAPLVADADEQVDKGQAVALFGGEGTAGIPRRVQRVLQIERPEHEVQNCIGPPLLTARHANRSIEHGSILIVDLVRDLDLLGELGPKRSTSSRWNSPRC